MKNQTLIHKNAMDCYIEVLEKTDEKWLVNWWNLGFTGNPWLVLEHQLIEVKKEDEKNWIEIDPKTERVK